MIIIMLCVFFLFAILGAYMFECDLTTNNLYKAYYKPYYNPLNNTCEIEKFPYYKLFK
mgnify:CR=1 FL=1